MLVVNVSRFDWRAATLIADSYAQMSWPGVVFRPLEERIPADLYIVYEQQQATPALEKLVAALTV